MRHILDTDVLIWILRGEEKIINSVLQITKGSRQAISLISVAEIFKNIFPSEMEPTTKFLEAHFYLSIDFEIAKTAGLYWQKYTKQRRRLNLLDCLIAATAKCNNLRLITCNVKHFPMEDIKVINPLKK